MRRILLSLAAALFIAAPAHANLLDEWIEVQSSLAAGDIAGAERAAQVLEERAIELDVRRMTHFSAALVEWAQRNPGDEGETAVAIARRLDPVYPSSYFLQASWEWQRGSRASAAQYHLKGWLALLRFEPSRQVISGVVVLWISLSLAAAFSLLILTVTVRYVRSLAFDARELGGRLFNPANAWVFGIVLMLLPLFAGLGPLWLLIYVFALSWVYCGQAMRIWCLVACLVLAMIMPTLSWVQERRFQMPRLSERVGTMLDERQLDFSTLREVSLLTDELDEVALYHLVYGELLRTHGEPSRAKIEFQKATLVDDAMTRPLIFIGNLELEEGNSQRAIQLFNQALEIDDRNAFAYHNLSLAFDLNRRFQEGDAARAMARDIVGRDSAENGLRGQDPRIRYPWIRSQDLQEMLEDVDPQQRLGLEPAGFSIDPLRELGSRLSLIFIFGAALGLTVLWIRLRAMPPARECNKCGKLYNLTQGFGESSMYCSQCVSVFQKRDVVSIEQQTAKLNQIRRWEGWTALVRRLGALLLPGSHQLLGGKVVRGLTTGFLAAFFVTGALVWVPMFMERIEPLAVGQTVGTVLLVLFGLVVARSGLAGWSRG